MSRDGVLCSYLHDNTRLVFLCVLLSQLGIASLYYPTPTLAATQMISDFTIVSDTVDMTCSGTIFHVNSCYITRAIIYSCSLQLIDLQQLVSSK